MFKELFSTILQVIFKPTILIPLITISLLSGGINIYAGWVLERPTIDFVLYYDSIPNDNMLGVMATNYPLELIALGVIGLVMTLIGIIAITSVARIAKGDGFSSAINDSIKEWKKALGLTIVGICAFIFFGFIFAIALATIAINALLSQILFIIIAIIFFVVIVKSIFVIPLITEFDLKKAFKESWKFTDKRFWSTLALIILSGLISFIGMVIISQIGIWIPADVELIFFIIGEAFLSAYFITAITNYYDSKQK